MLLRAYHAPVIQLHFTLLSTFEVVCICCIHAGCTIWCCVIAYLCPTPHSVTASVVKSAKARTFTPYKLANATNQGPIYCIIDCLDLD